VVKRSIRDIVRDERIEDHRRVMAWAFWAWSPTYDPLANTVSTSLEAECARLITRYGALRVEPPSAEEQAAILAELNRWSTTPTWVTWEAFERK
jgi:hypothetical protein